MGHFGLLSSSERYWSELKLKTYYEHAISKVYNCDDPRTWKSICVNCRRAARSLDGVLRCYVSCLLFIRLFNININVLDVIINDSP
jgi:hypothetical protein